MKEPDLFNLFDSVFNAKANLDSYESRKVGRDTIKGVGISTVYTTDCGYETAIIDKGCANPVERYETLEESKNGHQKWIDFIKDSTLPVTINKLGYGELIEDELISIEGDMKKQIEKE